MQNVNLKQNLTEQTFLDKDDVRQNLEAALLEIYTTEQTNFYKTLSESLDQQPIVQKFLEQENKILKQKGFLSLIGFKQKQASFKASLLQQLIRPRLEFTNFTPAAFVGTGQPSVDQKARTIAVAHDAFVQELSLPNQPSCDLTFTASSKVTLNDLRLYLLNRLQLQKNPRCAALGANAEGAKTSKIDALANLQEIMEELKVLGQTWQDLPEFKAYQEQFKNLNNWMGKILPNVLDAFLIIAVVSVMIRTVVLMLAGSVWAITLLGAGKQNIGAAPIVKEGLMLVVYLPLVVASYFLINELLNVVIPFLLKMTLANLIQEQELNLETLGAGLALFNFFSAMIALMIIAVIFMVPNVCAKLMGYSESDYSATSGNNKMDTNIMNRAGNGSAPANPHGANGGSGVPGQPELLQQINKSKEINKEV